MPQAKTPAQIRLDAKALKALLIKCKATVEAAKSDRDEINADIALAMESASNAGIPKDAFRLALKIFNMDEDSRAGFHVAYQLCLDAFGVPMEDQLFDASGMPNVRFAEPEEAGEPKKRGRPAKVKTQTEEIAETILGDGPTLQ